MATNPLYCFLKAGIPEQVVALGRIVPSARPELLEKARRVGHPERTHERAEAHGIHLDQGAGRRCRRGCIHSPSASANSEGVTTRTLEVFAAFAFLRKRSSVVQK